MRKNYLTRLFVLMIASFLALTGCDSGTSNGGQTTPPGTAPVTNPDPKTLSPALRAVPTAASNASPVVLDSYTDGTNNYYLIDVGYVRNMYVSTILAAAYNGMSPISVSKTTVNSSTITEALTETISESVTISNTQSGKVGIELAYAYKTMLPSVQTKFSAKLNIEWTGSWTKSNTSSRSSETSVSKTESLAESYTTSVTIGEHGEPAGNYRYALYATSDVYFIISTSQDNQSLLSWDTVVCARDSSYVPHWDYSPDGTFDNSPDGKEITFTEDFYKNLTKPVGTKPANDITTDFKTIRGITPEKLIKGGEPNYGEMDVVDFNDNFGLNINQLKQFGYKTASFYIELEVSERLGNCYQHLYLYSSPEASDTYRLAGLRFEHSPGLGKDGRDPDTTWWFHHEDKLKFEDISLDKFPNNEFVIRYGTTYNPADHNKMPGYEWYNRNLKIRLVIKG